MMVACERVLSSRSQLHIDPLPYSEVLITAFGVCIAFHVLLGLLQPLLELRMECVALLQYGVDCLVLCCTRNVISYRWRGLAEGDFERSEART